mmetsp:Transcript_17871/g.31307  ORF Transcript_17871/g.31307 Transcript_17871/m.31307 type:complete len:102 (+) Transcript_17871:217-522(+)
MIPSGLLVQLPAGLRGVLPSSSRGATGVVARLELFRAAQPFASDVCWADSGRLSQEVLGELSLEAAPSSFTGEAHAEWPATANSAVPLPGTFCAQRCSARR